MLVAGFGNRVLLNAKKKSAKCSTTLLIGSTVNFFLWGFGPIPDHSLPLRGLQSRWLDTPHLLGLLWTSDQPDAEISPLQHTTLTRDKHPFLWRDLNPQS